LKTNKIFLLYIISVNIILAQALPVASINTKVENEYSLFNKNVELIFESTVGEMKRTVTIGDGVYTLTNEADNFKYSQTFSQENDGAFLVKTEQNVNILLIFSKHAEITYTEPVIQLPKSVKVGDTWQWKGLQIKEDDSTEVTMTGHAIKEEVLTLPAGKFNTLKVEIISEDIDGAKTIFTQWLVPNIGSVKMNVRMEGHGLIQIAMAILGYDEVISELKEIKYLEQ
jgi:hypothetical protein